jgi:hypothetical protein
MAYTRPHKEKKEQKNSAKKATSVPARTLVMPKKKFILATIIIFIALVIIILLLIFWKSLFPPKALAHVYNGYTFDKINISNTWRTNLTWMNIQIRAEFYYHPQQLDKIPVDKNIRNDFIAVRNSGGQFYIGFDPVLSTLGTTAIAGTEVSKISGKYFGVPTKAGFTTPLTDVNQSNFTYPIVNCEMANSTVFVLEFLPSNENKISYKANCAVIYAMTPNDTIRMADLFVYKLINIIPDNRTK